MVLLLLLLLLPCASPSMVAAIVCEAAIYQSALCSFLGFSVRFRDQESALPPVSEVGTSNHGGERCASLWVAVAVVI